MAKFVETSEFGKLISRYLPGDAYLDLQNELVTNPKRGDVMPGCGGLRKLRIGDPRRQKGKRGGARVIYLHIPEVSQFLMLDIYDKNEKENLTAADKKQLRSLALEYKMRVIAAARAEKKEKLE